MVGIATKNNEKGSTNPADSFLIPTYSVRKNQLLEDDESKGKFKCCACGTRYKILEKNFPYSQSVFFKGNNNRLPICNKCIDDFTDQYTELFESQDEAIKRMALHWDMYLTESLLNSSKKTNVNNSRIKSYIKNCNLSQNAGKTYDTYLKESKTDAIVEFEDLKNVKIPQKIIKFFGLGFEEIEYKYLSDQYDDWTARHECKSKAQEELFKNLCIAQLNIQKASQGKITMKIESAMDAFQKLLDSANLKPKQTNDNTLADQNTFGTLIKKWENEKPIPEPQEEWKDVDGIIKYITVWFLGHLCKMMNIKNSYSRAYEKEMLKYKVEKPEYEDDDEALFDSIFGGDDDGIE